MDSKLDSLFERAVNDRKTPGVAAIALDASGNVLYKKTAGVNNLDDSSGTAYTSSTTTIMWSTTKLVTCVAALQLVEQGKLSLDDPVEKYMPQIKNIQVLDGTDENGKIKLREPKTKATVLNLMTHTSGFSYDLFDKPTLQWRIEAGQNPTEYLAVGAMANFCTPLINDPGKQYCYGVSIDWLGFVVEAISGLSLNKYVEAHITGPLGLKDTGSHPKAGAAQLAVHMRGEDGTLVANPAFALAASPEKYGGGHFLYSTLDDYSNFLLTILNKGTHPKSGVKILEEKTVADYLFTDQIPKICSNEHIGDIPSAISALTLTGRFLPGVELGWSCGLMLNLEDVPNGRKAGSGSWAGLGNLFYWIDPKSGKLGLVISSILPFMDKEILHLSDALERAVYGKEAAKEAGEKGSNFALT